MFAFLAWLEVNKQRLIVVVIVATLAGLGFAFYLHQQEQRELAANTALIRLTQARTSEGTPATPAAAELLKIAEEFPQTPAGSRALLLAAGALFTEGKHAEAKAQFDEYLSRNPGGSLAPVAALGSASSLEGMGQVDQAMAAYRQVAASHPTDPVANQAKLALALLHESKNETDQAIKLYEELARVMPPTMLSSEAAARRDQLQPQPAAPPAPQPVIPFVLPETNPPAPVKEDPKPEQP